MAHPLRAEDYPARPIKLLVGAPAGGTTDTIARAIAEPMAAAVKQPVLVENRPGAGGNLATEAVVSARPDGYTLLLTAPPNAINATLYEKLKFNFIRDIAPVAGIIRQPLVILVNPAVPATTVLEFIAYAKANPGKINFASSGIGSTNHLSGEMFKVMTGIEMIHIPYRGDVLSDLIGGQVQVYFGSMAGSIEYVRAGRLSAVAVTTATRSQALPDVPTVGEFVPGYEASSWYGVSAPRNTPVEIVEKLNKEINAGLADPKA